LAVLGLRVQDIHRSDDRARVEIDTQRSLARTDVLTGLPNCRGLHDRLAEAPPAAAPLQLLVSGRIVR
jgi:GGDEF domain-containing protein